MPLVRPAPNRPRHIPSTIISPGPLRMPGFTRNSTVTERTRMRRRKKAVPGYPLDLDNSGIGPVATPGPRAMNTANDFWLSGALTCRALSPSRTDAERKEAPRRRAPSAGTERRTENRSLKRRRGLRARFDPALGAEFAAAADEISAEYRRRLSGVGSLTRPQRAAAVRAIKEWRAAALRALRRDYDAKRAAAKRQARDNAPRSAIPSRQVTLRPRRRLFAPRP